MSTASTTTSAAAITFAFHVKTVSAKSEIWDKEYIGLGKCTPLCKSYGTFSQGMDINEFISDFEKYKNPAIKHYMLTYCPENLICVSLLIVIADKYTWGPHSLMSRSPHIIQLFEH